MAALIKTLTIQLNIRQTKTNIKSEKERKDARKKK